MTSGIRMVQLFAVLWLAMLPMLNGTSDNAEDIEGVQHGINVYYDGNLFRTADSVEKNRLELQWQDEQRIIVDLLDRLTSLNVDSLSLAVPIFTDAWASNRFYLDPVRTPDVAQIRFIAEQATSRDMSFSLKPLLDSDIFTVVDNPEQWRGTLQPVDPVIWFASYEELLLTLSRPVAELMDWLVVGTELTSLELPEYEPYWTEMINTLRSNLPDTRLVYGQNWWGLGPTDQPPHTPVWIGLLDAVGVSGYFPPSDQLTAAVDPAIVSASPVSATPTLSSTVLEPPAPIASSPTVTTNSSQLPDSATVDEITAGLERYRNSIVDHIRLYGLPLLVLELGIASQANAYAFTWTTTEAPVNLNIQITYLAAACPFYGSLTNGIWLWYSNIHLLQDPWTDPGFELIGKPAEHSIPLCFDAI